MVYQIFMIYFLVKTKHIINKYSNEKNYEE